MGEGESGGRGRVSESPEERLKPERRREPPGRMSVKNWECY